MPHLDSNLYPSLLLRIGLAFIIGGAIGFEREMRGHPAGLRTHILVCLGSALLALVDSINPDVQGKIAAQVVTGVGFLGAGTILRSDRGVPVHGLTTAASLWCTAAIGIALGYGGMSVWMALSAAVIIFLTLTVVGVLEGYALDKQKDRGLIITLRSSNDADASTAASTVLNAIDGIGVKVRSVRTDRPDASGLTKILHLSIHMDTPGDADSVAKVLSSNPEVSQFDWA